MANPMLAQDGPESLAERRVAHLAARLTRTLGIACALAETGRQVDLSGIEDGVGMLCAQALDVHKPHAKTLIPVLEDVLDRVNRLSALLAAGGVA